MNLWILDFTYFHMCFLLFLVPVVVLTLRDPTSAPITFLKPNLTISKTIRKKQVCIVCITLKTKKILFNDSIPENYIY